MKSFVCFITLIAVALAAEGIYYGRKPVIRSENAVAGEFPYQARIIMCTDLQCITACGGTIINQRAVLTSGFCCLTSCISLVGVGITKPLEGPFERKVILVAGFTKHQGFKESGRPYNNICIMHLVKSIKYSTNIQPAVLPIPGATPTGTAVLSGFGTTVHPNIPSNELRKANVQIISMAECGNDYASETAEGVLIEWTENSSIICTSGREVVVPCVFDHGGPLSQNGVVIGVVSFAHSMGYCDLPNSIPLFTSVSHYIDWINRYATIDFHGAKDTGDSIDKGEVGFLNQFLEQMRSLFNFGDDIIG